MTPEELNAIRERHMLRCQLEGSTPSAIHSVSYCDMDNLFIHIDTQDQEIKRLRDDLEAAKYEQDKMQRQLTELEQANASKNSRIVELEQELEAAKKELDGCAYVINALEAEKLDLAFALKDAREALQAIDKIADPYTPSEDSWDTSDEVFIDVRKIIREALNPTEAGSLEVRSERV